MFDYETFVDRGAVRAWVCLPEDEDGSCMSEVEFAVFYEPLENTGHGPEGDIVEVDGILVHEFGRSYYFSMDEAFGEIADEVAEAVEIEWRGQEVE